MLDLKAPIHVGNWAKTARPGEKIVYAQRVGHGTFARPSAAMGWAYEAHKAGLVFLSQRKEGHEGYLYEATRVSGHVSRLLGIHPDYKAWERKL